MFSSQSHACRSSPLRATYLAHLILLHFLTLTTSAGQQLTSQFSLPSCVSSLSGPNTFSQHSSGYTLPFMCETQFHTHTKQAIVPFCTACSPRFYTADKNTRLLHRTVTGVYRTFPTIYFYLFAVLISQCHSQIFKFCHVFIGVTS